MSRATTPHRTQTSPHRADDRSTNGTCIATDEGKARLIKNESVALYGNGLLFLVGRFNRRAPGGAASSRSEAPQQLARIAGLSCTVRRQTAP